MTTKAASAPEYQMVKIGDIEYKVRELTVDETDACDEGAKKPDGTIDGKLNTRLAISMSTDPVIDLDAIGKLGTTKYTLLIRAFNKMNTLADETVPNDPRATG